MPFIAYANRLTESNRFDLPTAPDAEAPKVPDKHCLFVNAPEDAGPGSDLPVVVFVHGGSLEKGDIQVDFYRGENFVANGCVYVAVNYRLRFEGWAPIDGRFNGFEDFHAAMAWVSNNIADFGGDPSNITLIGQSAGASMVMRGLCDPRTKSLVARAVALSMGMSRHRSLSRAALMRALLGGRLRRDRLNALSPARTRKAFERLARLTHYDMTLGWTDYDPAQLPPIPMLMGTMQDEMCGLKSSGLVDRVMAGPWNHHKVIAASIRFVLARCFDAPLRDGISFDRLLGDSAIRRFTAHTLATREDSRTWAYEIFSSDPNVKAKHIGDIPLLFNNLDSEPEMLEEVADADARERLPKLAAEFSQIIVDFAHGREPDWPAYGHDHAVRRFDIAKDAEPLAHTVDGNQDPYPAIRAMFPRMQRRTII